MLIEIQYFTDGCLVGLPCPTRFVIDSVEEIRIYSDCVVAYDIKNKFLVDDSLDTIRKISVVNLHGEDRVLYERERE